MAAGALVLTLAACGPDDPEDVDLGEGVAPTEEGRPADATDEPTDGAETSTAEPEAQASPAADECVAVPEPPNGVYAVADAGTVTVTMVDGALVLGDVAPAGGWEAEVVEESDDEVEVELAAGGEQLDLEVEIDDGAVVAQICADDD